MYRHERLTIANKTSCLLRAARIGSDPFATTDLYSKQYSLTPKALGGLLRGLTGVVGSINDRVVDKVLAEEWERICSRRNHRSNLRGNESLLGLSADPPYPAIRSR